MSGTLIARGDSDRAEVLKLKEGMRVLRRGLKWLRFGIALASLAAMTALFVWPVAWVVRWAGWLPSVQLVPAVMAGSLMTLVALAVSVALFGRLYCAVICPLGIAQDVIRLCFGWLLRRTRAPVRSGTDRSVRSPVAWMRYGILALFVVGVAFGFTGLIAPYGIFGRFLSVCCRRVGEPGVIVTVWSVGLFIFILAMTFVRARWWCNRICPVGTFLGLFSRFAVFRVRIDASKCVKCGLCAKACDKGALAVRDDKTIAVNSTNCVICLDCIGTCKKGALKWH